MKNPTYSRLLAMLLDAGCSYDEADRVARDVMASL